MAWSRWHEAFFAVAAWATAFAMTTASCPGQPVEVRHRSELKLDGLGRLSELSYPDTSRDGQLFIATDDRTIHIWDLESGALRRAIEQELVGKTIKIWDVVPGAGRSLIKEEPVAQARISEACRRMRGPRTPLYEKPISSLRLNAGFLSENRRIWITVNDDLQMSVSPDELLSYDLETRTVETIFSTGSEEETPHKRALTGHNFARRGSLVGYSVFNQPPLSTALGLVHLYDRNKKPVVASVRVEGASLASGVISDRGELLALMCDSHDSTRRHGVRTVGRIDLLDPRTGKMLGRVQADGSSFDPEMVFSTGGRDLAVMGGLDHNRIFIVYLNDNKIRYTLKAPGLPGKRIAYFCAPLQYTPDDRYLAASMTDGTVLFWDTSDYREVLWARLQTETLGGMRIAVSCDGKKLCGVGHARTGQGFVKVWELDQFLSLINRKRYEEGGHNKVREKGQDP